VPATITRLQLQERLACGDPLTLVETLPRTAFAKGHLPGAVCLPPDRVAELAPTLLPDKSALVVVYCGGFT
jgi:rhodanese-related sulfurtransferase